MRVERDYIDAWLQGEQEYQLGKWGETHDDEQSLDEWEQRVLNYLHRARVLGVDTLVGRQALAKAVATAHDMLATVIRNHGPLPKPGVSSGEASEVFEP